MTQKFIGLVNPDVENGPSLAALLTDFDAAYKSGQSGATRPPGALPGFGWSKEVSPGVFEWVVYDGATDKPVGTSNLPTEANRLAYWTSASTQALTVFTPFARTLLDDADAAAARSTLGLPYATQAEAEAGTRNDRAMTPLRVKQAVSAVAGGFGANYKWFEVTRSHGTSYQHTGSQPIAVSVSLSRTSGTAVSLQASSDAVAWVTVGRFAEATYSTVLSILSPGHYYRTTGGSVSNYNVAEFRPNV